MKILKFENLEINKHLRKKQVFRDQAFCKSARVDSTSKELLQKVHSAMEAMGA